MCPNCQSTNVKVHPGPNNTFGHWNKCEECGKIFRIR